RGGGGGARAPRGPGEGGVARRETRPPPPGAPGWGGGGGVAGPRLPEPVRELDRLRRLFARDLLEAFVEPARVRLLRLGERLEPLGELGEALLTRGLGHAWVHLRVLVRLPGDRGLEVLLVLAVRIVRDRVAVLFMVCVGPEG